jgi:hypothetical protein
MATVTLAGNGTASQVQGLYGTYQAASDGTFVVDTRDAPTLIGLGMGYLRYASDCTNFQQAPVIATVGQIVASTALSNGALTIAHQPDVPRQVAVEVGPGTTAITAGSVTVTYLANDGTTVTDVVSCITGASTGFTKYTSKGVVHVSTASVANIAGGASPFVRLNTTTTLCVIVDPNATDITFTKENTDGGDETIGTASTVTLGGIAPTTAPNSTHTYSFWYTYFAPLHT